MHVCVGGGEGGGDDCCEGQGKGVRWHITWRSHSCRLGAGLATDGKSGNMHAPATASRHARHAHRYADTAPGWSAGLLGGERGIRLAKAAALLWQAFAQPAADAELQKQVCLPPVVEAEPQQQSIQ